MLRDQLLDTSRGRIVMLLQRAQLTADEIAGTLGLTASAVRVQMTTMERDGVVRRVGRRPGITRPSQVFELTPEVEQLLSRAYIPLLSHMVLVFSKTLPAAQLGTLLREAGKSLADELMEGQRPTGSLESRARVASRVLNQELGALTHVEGNGRWVIRGAACPLSAVTGKHPAVCSAMESAVAEIVSAPVRECCDRTARPRCCFEIAVRRSGSARTKRARAARQP